MQVALPRRKSAYLRVAVASGCAKCEEVTNKDSIRGGFQRTSIVRRASAPNLFRGLVRFAVAGEIFGSDLNCLGERHSLLELEFGAQFLVAEIGAFLKAEILAREVRISDGQD